MRVREFDDGRAFEFDGGPTRETADDTLNFATLILLDLLEPQRDHFGLKDLEPLVQQCNADYAEIWHPEEFQARSARAAAANADTDTDTR